MKRSHLAIATAAGAVLLPWIPMPGGLPQLRPEWFVVMIGLLLLPVSTAAATGRVAASAGVVFALYSFSIIWGMVAMGVPLDPRDVTVLMQPLLYYFVFVFVASGQYSLPDYRQFLGFLTVAIGTAAAVAIVQFFNPMLLSPLLMLYAEAEQIELYSLLRATGTMGNPNDLGFLIVLGFALALFTMRHRVVPRLVSLVTVALTFAGTFATGSRTAMVNLFLVLFLFLILEGRRNLKAVILGFGILVAVAWAFQELLRELEWAGGLVLRVSSLGQFDEDTAWLPRVYGALDTLPMIAESPVFGHGSAKAVFTVGSNIDNEYILMLYRYGICGAVATAAFALLLARQLRLRSARAEPLLRSMNNFIWASLAIGSIFAYTAGLFMSFRLFALLIVIWTMTANVRVLRQDPVTNMAIDGQGPHRISVLPIVSTVAL